MLNTSAAGKLSVSIFLPGDHHTNGGNDQAVKNAGADDGEAGQRTHAPLVCCACNLLGTLANRIKAGVEKWRHRQYRKESDGKAPGGVFGSFGKKGQQVAGLAQDGSDSDNENADGKQRYYKQLLHLCYLINSRKVDNNERYGNEKAQH